MKYLLSIFFLFIFSNMFAQVVEYKYDNTQVDAKLAQTLDSIYFENQMPRNQLAKANIASKMDSLTEVIQRKDSSSLVLVESLLAKQGWLGPEKIGTLGVETVFQVIYHSNLSTQEKYFPLMQKAESEGKLLSSQLAMMEDMIALRNGEDQMYGTQFFIDGVSHLKIPLPVKNVDKLESLRKLKGLPSMAEVYPNWNSTAYQQNENLKVVKEVLKIQARLRSH